MFRPLPLGWALGLSLACRPPKGIPDRPAESPNQRVDAFALAALEETTETGDSADPEDSADPVDTGDSAEPEILPSAGLRSILIAQSWHERDVPTGVGAGQYRIIVLQESMYTLLPEIRAANPDALVLAYQKVGGMREDGGDHPSTGVQTGEAEDHEAWFLHDALGNRLEYCDYEGVMAANIGDPGYQAQWLANVRTRLARDGFDGVMMDDVNTFPGHCLGSRGTPIVEYLTDELYGNAVVAFMAAVGPELIDDGFIVAPNIAMNPWNTVMLAQSVAMLPFITHWFREYWMRWDDGEHFRGANWESTLVTMRLAQEAGRAYFALTYGPGTEGSVEGQRYGSASWLIAWDGLSESAWGYHTAEEGDDPYGSDWIPDIGLPEAEAEAVEGGWLRRYTGGTVVINPSEEDGIVFELGRPHLHPDGGMIESVSLDRGRALILRHEPAE